MTAFRDFIPIKCLLFLLLTVGITANAQNAESKMLYVNTNSSDTNYILQLVKTGKGLVKKAPNQALYYFQNAHQLSTKSGFFNGQAIAATEIGYWYFGNNVNESIRYASEAAALYEKQQIGITDEKIYTYTLLAESYDEKGMQDSSAYYYFLLSNEIESGVLKDASLAVDAYTKLTIFWLNLNYDLEAGDDYWRNMQSYVHKATEAANLLPNKNEALSSILFLKGAYYHGRKNFDSARYYYNEYIQQREKLKILPLLRKISTLVNIADTYLKEDKPTAALSYISKIEQLGNDPAKKEFLSYFMTFVNLMKAKAYFQKKDYPASIQLAEENLKKLEITGDRLQEDVVTAHKTLADAYEAVGNYQEALKYKNLFISLSAQLNKVEKMDITKRQEVRYRILANDKKIADQQLALVGIKEKLYWKNLIITGILLLFVFAAALFVLWRKKQVQEQILQKTNFKNLQNKLEIERLNAAIAGEEKERSRIARDLHDGVGGLLTAARMNLEFAEKYIVGEAAEDFKTGIGLVQEAAVELRLASHNLMPAVLLQEGLLKALKVFCKNITQKNGIKISFQALGNPVRFDAATELVIYRTVQELVHNVVKHACAKNALVQLSFSGDGGLDVTVEDDGKGMPSEKSGTGGIGLTSIADRVKAINGILSIDSSPGKGTSIFIELHQFHHEEHLV